jgi:ribonuclease III
MIDRNRFRGFEEKNGIEFGDAALLVQAFTHRSYLNENRRLTLSHNERLEFLGDAVIELAATEYLFKKYPKATEGELTVYRAALVNANILAEVAADIGMDEYLLLSKGEAKDLGRGRQYILANTYEALVGALYLDRGYDVARDFSDRTLFRRTADIISRGLWQDAKSRFQEKSQEMIGVTPTYELLSETGPDHDKSFTVAVMLGQEKVATGNGLSKQEAEQAAANTALIKKQWL